MRDLYPVSDLPRERGEGSGGEQEERDAAAAGRRPAAREVGGDDRGEADRVAPDEGEKTAEQAGPDAARRRGVVEEPGNHEQREKEDDREMALGGEERRHRDEHRATGAEQPGKACRRGGEKALAEHDDQEREHGPDQHLRAQGRLRTRPQIAAIEEGGDQGRVPRRPPHVGLEGGVGIVLVGAAVHEVPGERAIVIGVGAERLLHVEPGEEEDAEPERQGPQGDEAESAARPEPRLPAAHRPHAARTASVRPHAFQAVPGQTVDSRIAPGFRASRDAAEVRAGG